MKNTIKLLGIIALVAVIGFSFTACGGGGSGGGDGGDDGDGNPFVGTWKPVDNSVRSFIFRADLRYLYGDLRNVSETDWTTASNRYTYSGNTATFGNGMKIWITPEGSRFRFYYSDQHYYKQ